MHKGELMELPPRREMTFAQRVYTAMVLDLGTVTVFAPYAWHGQMEPIERKPHRAYPSCCAREWPRYRQDGRPPLMTRWDRPKGEPYPWCPDSARWHFGEMDLCPVHAAQAALGIAVVGVPADGRWK